MTSTQQLRRVLGTLAWHAILIVVSLLVLIPIVFLVLGSFKTVQQFFASPYGLPESWTPTNYVRAWQEAAISTTFPNSLIVTVCSVALSTSLSCLAAYGLARFTFRLRFWMRLLFVGGLVVPVQLIMLPLFVILRQIGLLGTLPGLIVAYSVFGVPLGVLILVGFFATLPRDLEDAARIDGANAFPGLLRRHATAHAAGAGGGGHPERRLDVERLLHRPDPVDQTGHPYPAASASSTSTAPIPPSGA